MVAAAHTAIHLVAIGKTEGFLRGSYLCLDCVPIIAEFVKECISAFPPNIEAVEERSGSTEIS